MRCPACGTPNGPAARFCDQCGSRMRPARSATSPGDRRIVTALFADLVDYVRMIAEHDPEDVKQRVDAALAMMAEAVRQFDGTIEKFIGDAVFAVFGFPRAHDDDALRAALCATAIRDGLADLSRGGEPLRVRIGIATGEVVATRREDGPSHEAGLTGPAVVNAARIQDLARPGDILLDEATVRASRDRLDVDDRGAELLRGQRTPIRLFALRGEVTPLRSWGPPAGRLVGRRAERRRLRDALEGVSRTGRGRAILVEGEAGMGKSRLVADVEPVARAMGLRWTWTDNVSYASGQPYRFMRAFAQALADEEATDSGTLARRLLFTPDQSPEAVRRIAGGIAAVARDASFSGWEAEASLAPTEPREVAGAVLDAATRYIERLVEVFGPRVVVVDDLHLADASSMPALDQLIALAGTLPLVVLCTARPRTGPAWIGRPHVERIELTGLDADDTERLAADVAGTALDSRDALRLHERTGGNPLFIRELVRAHLDDGGLAGGRLPLDDGIGGRPVPLTLRALLGARIDALPEDARELLGVAAVIGVTFSVAVLADIADGQPDPAALEHLRASGLALRAEGGEALRFGHPLIREVAYAGLLISRRRALHARLADHLETHAATAIGRIAHHRAAAGDRERAVPLLDRAARESLELGAPAEAAGFWRTAADLAGPGAEGDAFRRLADEAIAGRVPA